MEKRILVLTAQSIGLAEMTMADQPSFQQWQQSPELRALIDDHRIPTIDDQLAWFARVQKPDRKFFSLVTLPDEKLIGHGGFVDIDDTQGVATLRITIGDPDAVGKGYGTEAVRLLTHYGFKDRGWKKIFLKVLASNLRAISAYEKVGFASVSEEVQDGKTIRTMELLPS